MVLNLANSRGIKIRRYEVGPIDGLGLLVVGMKCCGTKCPELTVSRYVVLSYEMSWNQSRYIQAVTAATWIHVKNKVTAICLTRKNIVDTYLFKYLALISKL